MRQTPTNASLGSSMNCTHEIREIRGKASVGNRNRVMTKFLVASIILANALLPSVAAQKAWWQTWDNFPKVPRIVAADVKTLVLSGQKAIFVYSGYKVPETVCGSVVIPYTLVPPNADGSRIVLDSIPKDYWIFCYCP